MSDSPARDEAGVAAIAWTRNAFAFAALLAMVHALSPLHIGPRCGSTAERCAPDQGGQDADRRARAAEPVRRDEARSPDAGSFAPRLIKVTWQPPLADPVATPDYRPRALREGPLPRRSPPLQCLGPPPDARSIMISSPAAGKASNG